MAMAATLISDQHRLNRQMFKIEWNLSIKTVLGTSFRVDSFAVVNGL